MPAAVLTVPLGCCCGSSRELPRYIYICTYMYMYIQCVYIYTHIIDIFRDTPEYVHKKNQVAVEELNLRYDYPETTLFTMYSCYRKVLWEFPKIGGPDIDTKVVDTSSSALPKEKPPIYRNSHPVLMILSALNLPYINLKSPLKEPCNSLSNSPPIYGNSHTYYHINSKAALYQPKRNLKPR